MSTKAMPFMILNGGVDMLFIMIQRLEAQNLEDQQRLVVGTIASHLFDGAFLDEVFRPQQLYGRAAMRDVFDRLALSSVMTLSRNSLNKLFDIVVMGIKQLFYSLRHPYELVEVTLNYLESFQSWLGGSCLTVAPAIQRFRTFASTLTVGELADIRVCLLEFLHSKRVRSLVLMDAGLQNSDSSFNIPKDAYLPPLPQCEAPGTIRFYDREQRPTVVTFPHRDAGLLHPPHIPVGAWNPVTGDQRMNHAAPVLSVAHRDSQHRSWREIESGASATTELRGSPGLNHSDARSAAQIGAVTGTAPTGDGQTHGLSTREVPTANAAAEAGALNHLAGLVRGAVCNVGVLHLALFADDEVDTEDSGPNNDDDCDPKTPAHESHAKSAGKAPAATTMTHETVRSANTELVGIMSYLDDAEGTDKPTTNTEEQDLLDLIQ